MDYLSQFTRFAVGRSVERGGGGDPSPVTAETVYQALLRGLAAATGSGELDGRHVGVIGLGKVGYRLAAKLRTAGATVVACDLDPLRSQRFAEEHGGEIVSSAKALMALPLDVLAPCAAGGTIDEAHAHSLDCSVVVGAANNPLTSREVGSRPLGARDPLRARLPRELRRPHPRVARVVPRARPRRG